ncbi:MAG: DUF983 domain-containing protein [Flavobacteriales bacterium CG_4_10_14_0_2_um_filter_35_18]|nr:MAG: DUF983 domain-containing protein [Flavobacteriales bacterium CG_4_10_14_0_2_um_filter_35_18]
MIYKMLQKGTKVYSIFHNKCPKCQNGDFFINHSAFNFKNVLKIHDHCPSCHFKFMIEPSFFYGAMYVTYGLTVIAAVILFLIGYLIGLTFVENLIFMSIALAVLSPLSLRLSRLIYINMFVDFEKSKPTNR